MSVLDDLERLDKAATPGEWKYGNVFKDKCYANGELVFQERDGWNAKQDDRDLIAASRNALPALLRLARAAEQSVKDLNYSSGSTIEDDACCARDSLSAALRDLGVEV